MKITLKGKDNSVAIMELVEGADKDVAIRKLNEAHPEKQYEQIPNIPLPDDRAFRDAWEVSKKGDIKINEEKAKDIHLCRIREERNKKLKELDVETLKAINNAEQLQKVEDKKQTLRNLPQNIKGLEWPEELN